MPNVRLALVLMTFLGRARPYTLDLGPKNHDPLSNGKEVDVDLPIVHWGHVVSFDTWFDEDGENVNGCGCGDVSSMVFWFWVGSSICHVWCELFGIQADVDYDAWPKTMKGKSTTLQLVQNCR